MASKLEVVVLIILEQEKRLTHFFPVIEGKGESKVRGVNKYR